MEFFFKHGLTHSSFLQVAPDQKLPQLYLLDSIIKNHTAPYASLFQQNLVSVFAGVFQACPNEKIRAQLFKLRSTWGPFFTYAKLNQLDRRVKEIDPAWPVQVSASVRFVRAVHVKTDVFGVHIAGFEEPSRTAAGAAGAEAAAGSGFIQHPPEPEVGGQPRLHQTEQAAASSCCRSGCAYAARRRRSRRRKTVEPRTRKTETNAEKNGDSKTD